MKGIILLSIFVIIIILWIFENINEKFDILPIPESSSTQSGRDSIVESPILPKIKSRPKCYKNAIRENTTQDQYYVDQKAHEQGPSFCPLKMQTADEFNLDFFNFRDKVYHNSSMVYDSVATFFVTD